MLQGAPWQIDIPVSTMLLDSKIGSSVLFPRGTAAVGVATGYRVFGDGSSDEVAASGQLSPEEPAFGTQLA